MDIIVFPLLSQVVCQKIGEAVFKSEEWINNKYPDNNEHTIPTICGEIKITLSIWFLSGGSYLDLVPLFVVSRSYLYSIFETFLEWILMTFEFPLVRYLREGRWDKLLELADMFS